jgi:dTDP-4-amino-4,6-dideoxygalactose transaminase
MIGGFGACEVFSFHATKFINSFEGGAVVTNDDGLADKLRLMRNFGFKGFDNVIYLGTNGKMTEICAAMGLTSLDAAHDLIAINRRLYEAYRSGLANLPGVSLIHYDPGERNNYQYVVLEIHDRLAPLNRDELVTVLHAENVLARKYFWPGCHRLEPYRSLQPDAAPRLPETERLAARILLLPTGETLGPETVALICGLIRRAFEQAAAIRQTLARPPGPGN